MGGRIAHSRLDILTAAYTADQLHKSKKTLELWQVEGKDLHLLTPPEVAEELHKSEKTLERWRAEGKGPPFVRIGKTPFYRPLSTGCLGRNSVGLLNERREGETGMTRDPAEDRQWTQAAQAELRRLRDLLVEASCRRARERSRALP